MVVIKYAAPQLCRYAILWNVTAQKSCSVYSSEANCYTRFSHSKQLLNLKYKLANANSHSRWLGDYIISPVRRLSYVTFVHPTQRVEIFGNISTPFGTLAIRWHSPKILQRSSQGNPSVGGFKRKRLSKYSDFGHVAGYISETVQDRR